MNQQPVRMGTWGVAFLTLHASVQLHLCKTADSGTCCCLDGGRISSTVCHPFPTQTLLGLVMNLIRDFYMMVEVTR